MHHYNKSRDRENVLPFPSPLEKLRAKIAKSERTEPDGVRTMRSSASNLLAAYAVAYSAVYHNACAGGSQEIVAFAFYDSAMRAIASKVLAIYSPHRDDGSLVNWEYLASETYHILLDMSRRSDAGGQAYFSAAQLFLRCQVEG